LIYGVQFQPLIRIETDATQGIQNLPIIYHGPIHIYKYYKTDIYVDNNKLDAIKSEKPTTTIKFFMNDQTFLETAYKMMLGRNLNLNEAFNHQQQLRQGLSRHDFVEILANSPEFTKGRFVDIAKTYDDQTFLEMAYQIVFGRNIDTSGLYSWRHLLQQGLNRHDLIKMLLNSPEFVGRTNEIGDVLHNARLQLVRTILPLAEVILDLGGASSVDPRGALLSFGYPYHPKKLYIVDLPPHERMFPASEVPLHHNYEGCEVEYVYGSMADLSGFQEESFDLIWSGESIEHVNVEDCQKVLKQVHRLLKKEGKFALDTPNRRVTKLQHPNAYIHPEHKIEYYYEDFLNLLKQNDFEIVAAKGIIELSQSLNRSEFLVEEFLQNSGLNDNPANSYLFYVCCVKSM